MKNFEINIDICVATYKRPYMLANNLQSIIKQSVSNNVNFRVIVIDNDIDCSAKGVVYEIQKQSRVEVVYDVEARQNIAAARNKALTHVTGDYFVCVDDDEWVSDGWLMTLFGALKKYNADVVFGPVVEVLPEGVESWIIEGGFFKRKSYESGKLVKHGATNNVLMKRSIVDAQPFNESFGLTGGSDTELFHKLYQKGYKLIWCNEAYVSEKVLDNRLNLKWLLMRSYRGGQGYIRVYSKYWTKSYLIYWYMRRVINSMLAIILSVTYFPVRKAKAIYYLRKLMSNIGQLTGNFGLTYKEYSK
jgi:succinoglycan biosynthesis protein ExoM